MMGIFMDAVTVYSHYKKNRVDSWKRTVYEKVMWSESVEKQIDANGVLNIATNISITIPYAAELPIDPSSNLNVVVYGKCPALIDDKFTIADLRKQYKSAIVKAVEDNTIKPRLKNWKLVCV